MKEEIMEIRNRYTNKVMAIGRNIKTIIEINKADLREADLMGADLTGIMAILNGKLPLATVYFHQFPSIRLLSSIVLHNLSDSLMLELMRRDAYAHPKPELFNEWIKIGKCPYKNEERFWLFEPKREIWQPGLPQMADRDLIIEICKNQGWKIRGYLE